MSSKTLPIAIMAFVVLAKAVPALCAEPTAPDASASIGRGLQLAERNCSQCHAIGMSGESPNAMAPAFRELHRRYPAGSLEEAFGKGLLTHTAAMPKIRLSPAETADLVAYFKAMRDRGETEAMLTGPARWRLARR